MFCKTLWISEKRSFKVGLFGTPVCSTSCSTRSGREPHFFALLRTAKIGCARCVTFKKSWCYTRLHNHCRLGKIKNPDFRWKSGFYVVLLFFAVVPPGIEPGTQGFSVLCSTNWAMAPSYNASCLKASANIWCFFFLCKYFIKKIKIYIKNCMLRTWLSDY